MNKTILKIKMLAPWWHDIYFPELKTSTQKECGVDLRILQAYEIRGFPNGYFNKTPLANIVNKRILEIGPASGFYTVKLAQQKNRVTCIEAADRFINQLQFLRRYFKLEKMVHIIKGEFPTIIPKDEFDAVLCLGVLYHVHDYSPFLSKLNSLSAQEVYLETLISKTGSTAKAGTNEGFAFSDPDIQTRILGNMPDYKLVNRIDFVDSENSMYNSLGYYRCLLVLNKKG